MSAENERLLDAFRNGFDFLERFEEYMSCRRNLLQPINVVVSRGRVAEKDLIPINRADGKAFQPSQVPGRKLRVCVGIRRGKFAGRRLDEIAIVIAAHGKKIERHEQIGRARRFQRTAQAISEIDDAADAEASDIGKHRLERGAVAMNVGDRGKAHQLPL